MVYRLEARASRQSLPNDASFCLRRVPNDCGRALRCSIRIVDVPTTISSPTFTALCPTLLLFTLVPDSDPMSNSSSSGHRRPVVRCPAWKRPHVTPCYTAFHVDDLGVRA